MAGTSTPYSQSRTGQWLGIASHGNVPGKQEHQQPQPGRAPPVADLLPVRDLLSGLTVPG
jgi:hypothetical protein